MADEPRPHLWIPTNRTRVEPVTRTGGGASYTRADLVGHGRRLADVFRHSLESIKSKLDGDLAADVVVKISVAPDWTISRERQHLRNLGFEIISAAPEPTVAIAKLPRESLARFHRRLDQYATSPRHIGKSNFCAIESIAPVAVAEKVDAGLSALPPFELMDCLITLYSAIPPETKRAVVERLVEKVSSADGHPPVVREFANGETGLTARLSRADIDSLAEQFMFIRSIEANGEILSETAIPADPLPTIIQVDPPSCQSPVVVIDSGINTASPLMAGIVRRTIAELPPNAVGPHLAHGTFVASRVVYGDEITRVLSRRASPWCPVIDVQVTGDDGIGNRITQKAVDLSLILQRIVPVLASEASVFNLSLGLQPIGNGQFSSLAKLIDFLSREHKVLFVISAGNVEPTVPPPNHYLGAGSKVMSPAESLLSLSVGAVARHFEPPCIAQVGQIAPYSRHGPGADGGRKPELAAHGGNVLFDGIGWATSPRVAAYGLDRSGAHLSYAFGTSCAAPIVSQYAARLFGAYPEANPNLVRALLTHCTVPVKGPEGCAPLQPEDFCGFGAVEIDRALYSGPSSASYLFQGTVQADNYLYVPFYVPEALASAATGRLVIRGTVVFDPPVNPDDSVNYSLCRVAARLRKRVGSDLRDVTVGGDEDDVLVPWNPTLHFAHRFQRGYSSGEWELRLRLMTRGTLAPDFAQTLAVVIDVQDDSGGVDVRSAILTEMAGVYVPAVLRVAA